MTDVAIKFDVEGAKTEEGRAVNRMYPKDVIDLFAGEQLVIVGRYKKPGDAKVIDHRQGRRQGAEVRLSRPSSSRRASDETHAFVEKLWAMRRIGEIIDELDLKGKNDELVKELVALSTKHGILTPYTSFLADENASTDLAQMSA